MKQSVANWLPPMGKWLDRQTSIKHVFPILSFAFQLPLPHEVVLEREQTMANEEHFFLPTSKSECPCHLPSLLGNEMIHMPRRLLRTPLKGMSVDFYMSGRKFSMPLSYIFPQITVPSKLEKKHFLSGKKLISKMALFFAF